MRLIDRHGIQVAYLVLIHVFLALMLWKSDFLPQVARKLDVAQPVHRASDHYESMLQYHLRMDTNVPDKVVVFIGDSLTQGLYTDAAASPSVNYGIGGDTTVGVLRRLPHYRSLFRASAVVLAIGVNDMKSRDNWEIVQTYRRILQDLPPAVPVVCSAVLPVSEARFRPHRTVSNSRIRDLNTSLKKLCLEKDRRLFLDIGSKLVDTRGDLAAAFQDGDGVHLNSAGNGIWIGELRVAVRSVRAAGLTIVTTPRRP
jgi:lysophospholipase L1-like esterase